MTHDTKNEIELQILGLFCKDRGYYTRYAQVVSFSEIPLKNIFEQIKILYLHTSENYVEQENLESVVRIAQFDVEMYSQIIRDIYEIEVNEELVRSILATVNNKHILYSLQSKVSQQIEEGSFTDLSEILSILSLELDEQENNGEETVSLSLEEHTPSQEGFLWPWGKLNERLGRLSIQTHGLIAAPVETGKTAFITNCSLGWRRQGAKILHINNEDPAFKLLERYYINYFEKPNSEIQRDLATHSNIFQDAHGGSLILIDQTDITPFVLEQLQRIHKPDIVIIDQIDHMARDSEAATLERLYHKVRTIGKKRNVCTLSVTQASHTPNDYLVLSDLHNSKVGKQAALDYMIGIKTPAGYPLLRNISFPKNKLTGDHRSCVMRWNPTLLKYED